MPKTMTIKPAHGLRVRTPDGGLLPESGATVERNSYWIRRLDDADVIEVVTGPATTTED
jgi:hypothetical protein